MKILGDRPWLVGDGHADHPVLMERSDDGSTWIDRRDELGNVLLDAVAANTSGMWIFARTPEGSPLTIHSLDGVEWSTEPLRAANGGPIQVNVTATLNDALVVLGSAPSGGVRLVRARGGGWDQTALSGFPNTQSTPDFEAISVGAGPLIGISSGFSLELGGLWVSADGIAWRRLPMPPEPGASVAAVAVHGDRVVLVGSAKLAAGSGTVTRDAVSTVWTAALSVLAP